MNSIYKIVMACIACAVLVAVAGCSDDELNHEGLPEYEYLRALTVAPPSVALSANNADANAVTFSWQGYEYTSSATLQFCANKDFAEDSTVTASIAVPTDSAMAFSHSRLNAIAESAGLEDGLQAPLYARVKYVRSHSLGYRYSDVAQLAVTPYETAKEMDVLEADMTTTKARLYSAIGNKGLYAGMADMEASAAVYFKDYKNVVWGAGDGNFSLSNDNALPASLPAYKGWYYITADTRDKSWTASLVTSLTIAAGQQNVKLKYDESSSTWSGEVNSTGALSISTCNATMKKYSAHSNLEDGKAETVEMPIPFTAADVPQGRYVVTLSVADGKIAARVDEAKEGDQYLFMVDKDNYSSVKCKLYSSERNNIYKGLYRLGAWENFRFTSENGATVYGSAPNELYKLDSSAGAWDIWNDEDSEGFFLITANTMAGTWSKQKINSVTVAGDFNGWSTDKDAMAYDPASKTWKATVSMNGEGSFTILLNKDWKMRFGKTGDGVLAYGSEESLTIPQPGQGAYLLTVNTYDMGHIVYTLTKK